MKQLSKYNNFILFFLVFTYGNAQKQTKTFTEKYTVAENAILNISTTHTDIVFETWDKNEVSVEVIIEIEGADTKDLDTYFKQNEIKILGNSKQIDITTGVENTWFFKHSTGGFDAMLEDQNLNFSQLSTTVKELENLSFMMDSLKFPDFPKITVPEFNYEAFEKDGETYLKKWQKNFDANFSKKDQEEFTRMAVEFEAQRKLFSKDQENFNKDAMVFEKDRNAFEKRRKKLLDAREERKQAYEERRQLLTEKRINIKERSNESAQFRLAKRNDSMYFDTLMLQKRNPNVYYFNASNNQKSNKVKVKKYLKIKMPKTVTLKMNVRHGEVKLAENTKNINGTFAYSGLYAMNIDGDKTQIDVSYSPIKIENWNYGKLKVNYSDDVSIKEATNLTLTAISSEVTIDKVLKRILVENNLGSLTINEVSKDFYSIDVAMKNGELFCKLPKTPFTIAVNGENSKVVYPSIIKMDKTKNFNSTLHKGFYISKNPDKNITINATFSDVTLE